MMATLMMKKKTTTMKQQATPSRKSGPYILNFLTLHSSITELMSSDYFKPEDSDEEEEDQSKSKKKVAMLCSIDWLC